MADTSSFGLAKDELSEVDGGGSGYLSPRQGRDDLRAHLIAPSADGRPAVEAKVTRVEALGREKADCGGSDPRGSPFPAGMQQGRASPGVADEDRNAVGQGHRHGRGIAHAQMAVRIGNPKNPTPAGPMVNDLCAVDLMGEDQTVG